LKVKDFDYAYNFEQIKRSYQFAVEHSASLVLFPELTLTGWFMVTDAKFQTEQNHLDNRYYVSRVFELVQQYKIPVCLGAFLDNQCVYLFMDSTGYKIIRKRKAHLTDVDKSGDFFEFGNKKFSTLICDETMCETSVNNTLMGDPDILLHPSAYGEPLPYKDFPIVYDPKYNKAFEKMLVVTTNITDSYMHENVQTFGRTSILLGNNPVFNISSKDTVVVSYDTETKQIMSWNVNED